MRAVLTYHAIDRSGSVISVTPEGFQSHVDWLAAGHVRVVDLAELLALPDEVDAVTLTFDDALESVATEAAPRLGQSGLSATVFVATDHVGTDNSWGGASSPGIPVASVLDWEAIGALSADGWIIGAHSRTHPHLTQCSDQQLVDELAGSADAIETQLGKRPSAFAYPYGDCDDRVASATAKYFREAVTTEHQQLVPESAPLLLPRLDAWYFRDATTLRQWGSRRFRRGIAWRHALRRVRRMIA